jgi:hypothetical protein
LFGGCQAVAFIELLLPGIHGQSGGYKLCEYLFTVGGVTSLPI